VGDAGRVRQVLLNLSGNAIKFTSQGHVLIGIECEEQTETHAQLRIWIKDTGIGISDDKIPLLFEKFSQADSSTTRRFGGTGLGLAISKQLVALMEGKIVAESRLAEGSTFWFTLRLPLDKTPTAPFVVPRMTVAMPLPKTVDRAVKGLEGRILVAEDNVVNQRVAILTLQKFGCRVDVAANGKEAVEMWETIPYDLILMDCNMPEMDGLEATAQIRKREAGKRHIPIIAMTANAIEGDREKCLTAGMDDYISKPVKPPVLRHALERWLMKEPVNCG
jgi:CheY-like chemotaxis protein